MKDPHIQVLVTIRQGEGKVTITSGFRSFPKEMPVEKAARYALAEALEKVGVEPQKHLRD